MKKEKNCSVSCAKKTSIGGQALMEGIMMRGPEVTAMAVRNPEGEMVIESFPTETKKRAKFFKLPVVRGVFNYIDSMVLGIKCLLRSAEISGLEEAEEEMRREKEAKKAKKAARKAGKEASVKDVAASQPVDNESIKEVETAENNDEVSSNATVTEAKEADKTGANEAEKMDTKKEKKESSALIGAVMFFSVALGIVFSIALFIIVPAYLYKGAIWLIPGLKNDNPAVNSLIKSVFEGVLKIVILVGYMAVISLMKDIKRTFMYHGAEHKTIFCYEQGLPLTVENVRSQRRFHPRCGTSFLILMLLVGIFISFFIDPLFYLIFGFTPITVIRVLIKLILLPLIVGIGYELIKIAGRYDNLFTRIISAPGVWLQHITTKEPDDSMIECAIASLEKVIPENDSDKW
ncbi:MAG: DUF1385 domain-containing protein [Ruminococcaceae bacterium]|nr:DUF1385 domain-containing protein [Oscillospiraceae bacterium]